MRLWLDTEFIDNGTTIELLSIGLVREDGQCYYAEANADRSRANEWVKANVIPNLSGPVKSRSEIKADLISFCGTQPEFWAYYADYDWVVLCQLFGTMMDLPKHWPMFCMDIKQTQYELGNPKLPAPCGKLHNALDDARWGRLAWSYLQSIKNGVAA